MSLRRPALLLVSACLIGGHSLAAPATADEQSAEEFLKEKGIRRLGATLALADETELSRMVREEAALKRTMVATHNELAGFEAQAAQNRQLITEYTQQRRLLRAQYERTVNVAQRNQLVSALNELGDRIVLLIEKGDLADEIKEARTKHNEAREAYIQHVLDMRKLAEKIRKDYDDLAADPEVQAAVERLNKETGRSYELVESRAFQTHERNLKRLEDSVLSEAIDLRSAGSGTFYVNVVFNSKQTRELVLDSGASLISLPHKMAVEIGAEPKQDDPDLLVRIADGSTVQAKLVMIPEVRVGKFTVENVECGVMPAHLPDAPPLLGMSFLSNFSFQVDSDRSKLTMTRVDSPELRARPAADPPARGRGRRPAR